MNREMSEKVMVAFHMAWNQDIPKVDKRYDELVETWSSILADISVHEARKIFKKLKVLDTPWLPRPTTIRKMALKERVGTPPKDYEAWGQFRTMADALSVGTVVDEKLHEVILATIKALGGRKALDLTTNGDRELFFRAYADKLAEWEETHYAFGEPVE